MIFDDVGWRNGSSMIEEHDSFEIDIKLVIVNDDDVEQDSGEIEWWICFACALSNHLYQMIGRYINLGRLTHNNRYAFSFFSKPGAPSEKFKVPLFKNQPKEKEAFTTNENSSSAKKTLEDIVSKINEANKYFLGVKLNTNYLKINKTVKYVEISQQKLPSSTSNDFPLDFSKDSKKLDSFKSFNDSSIL